MQDVFPICKGSSPCLPFAPSACNRPPHLRARALHSQPEPIQRHPLNDLLVDLQALILDCPLQAVFRHPLGGQPTCRPIQVACGLSQPAQRCSPDFVRADVYRPGVGVAQRHHPQLQRCATLGSVVFGIIARARAPSGARRDSQRSPWRQKTAVCPAGVLFEGQLVGRLCQPSCNRCMAA